ncbi:MAG: DHH family phosphoesterase [Lachnospiraceae bacterium]|nr:DHH family phosphoesterase [Lachnospiraceae bacterium]
MRLSELHKFNDITIQTHDNPDPDAIASAFGLYKYFTSIGKNAQIVYSGRARIQKSNLILMIKECDIPITYVDANAFHVKDLLITVDCQYKEGNVTDLEADSVAIIDHHQGIGQGEYIEIRPNLGSCATLVWQMICQEGYDIKSDLNLGTALYYGLMTDTGNFMELSHPLDRDMLDNLNYSKALIKIFSNSNISLQELEIAGQALIHYNYNIDFRYSLIFSKPCDPNILGFINDLALQVDEINVSIVYNEFASGYKLSIRSCVKEVRANELADYVTEGIGSGGGHIEKAGGYIDKKLYKEKYGDKDLGDYFKDILNDYFENCEIIDNKTYDIDISDMDEYKQLPVVFGYVTPSEFLKDNTPVVIRTLEGDIETEIKDDMYIMIGLKGEIWPIKKDKFEKSYNIVDVPYVFDGQYEPMLHVKNEGIVVNLVKYAKSCVKNTTANIYAKELDHRVKVFTLWDSEHYYLGKPGDYIIARKDDLKDVYIVEHSIFLKSYGKVE